MAYQQQRDAIIWYWFILPGLVIGGGYALDQLLHLTPYPRSFMFYGLAGLIGVSGVAIIQAATLTIKKIGQGTPSPAQPPIHFIDQGCYQFCRHPMSLGYDLAALAVVMACGSYSMLFITYPALLYWQHGFLHKEEHRLQQRFGWRYLDYCQRTPQLLPYPRFLRKKC